MRKVYFGNKSQQYTMKGCTEEQKSLQKAFWVRKIAEERDRFNNDWVPTLNLGKTKYCKVDHEAIEVRAAWFKKRQKIPLECLEYAAVKCQQLDARGLALENIDLGEGSSTEETVEEENQSSNLCTSCDHDDSVSCSVSQTDPCCMHSVFI